MSTATAEAPASTEPELNLNGHVFSEDGYCYNPEIVVIAVPKNCLCELRLARDLLGCWHAGYNLAVGQDSKLDALPFIGSGIHPTRAEALGAALAGARDFFQASPKSREHKLCAKAVLAAAAKIAAGSPANTAKARPGPLPEPESKYLPVAKIEPHPQNPRGEVKAADVAELAETIKAQGLLQPVGVRIVRAEGDQPGINGGRLQLLWGHRRLKAFEVLKFEMIPCRVYENISDDQARLVMSIENDEREDLDPIKRAKNYAAMMADFEMTQDDVAGALKKSRPVIANALRLLELPADVQEKLATGQLSSSHGTALCRFKDWPAICSRIAHVAVDQKSSAGELETGLPFDSDLVAGGLVVRIAYHTDLSPAQRKDPDYFKDGYGWFCLNPEKWRQAQKDKAAARREEKKKEAAKEATQKKTTKKEYFAEEHGVAVEDHEKHLLALVPDEFQVIGRRNKWSSGKCTIVTDRDRWTQIKQLASELAAADLKAKLTPIFAKAWKHIEAVKKFDGWCMAVLCGADTRFDAGDFNGDAAKRLKLGLAKETKKVFTKDNIGQPVLKLAGLAACDPVEVSKLVAGSLLTNLETKFLDGQRFTSSYESWVGFLAGGMDRADFGLLTTEGLVEQIRQELLPKPGDRVEWGDAHSPKDGSNCGIVITQEEYEKGTGAKWDFKGATPTKRDKSNFGDPFGAIRTDGIRIISRASAAAAPAKAKKGAKKK